MNQKKAKRLRNAARLLTTGMPERGYKERTHTRLVKGSINPKTGIAEPFPIQVKERMLVNDCTRAAYQHMKKEMV